MATETTREPGSSPSDGDKEKPGPVTIRGLPRPLARAMERYSERLDVALIQTAYEMAAGAHEVHLSASSPHLTPKGLATLIEASAACWSERPRLPAS